MHKTHNTFQPSLPFLSLLTTGIGHCPLLLGSSLSQNTSSLRVSSLLASFSTDRLAWECLSGFEEVETPGGRGSQRSSPHRHPPSSSWSRSRVICFSSCPLLCVKQSTTCLSIGSPVEELVNPDWCCQSSKNQLISDFLKLLHQKESQMLLHLFQVCEKHLVSLSETQFSYLQDGIIKTFFLGSLWAGSA